MKIISRQKTTKTIAFMAMVLMFLSSCSGNKKETYLEQTFLRGKVKNVELNVYQAMIVEDGELIRDSLGKRYWSRTVIDINKDGYITCMRHNDPEGNMNSQHLYLYDEHYNLKREIVENASKKQTFETVYQYDDNNNMIHYKKLDSVGGVIKTRVSDYDENGNRVEGKEYDADGSLNYRFLMAYDKNGNIIEVREFDSSNNLYMYSSFQYNEDDKLVAVNEFPGGGLDKKTHSEYDENGNLVNKKSVGGEVQRGEFRVYDEMGNIKEWLWMSSDSTSYRRYVQSFTYDSRDNWTEMVRFIATHKDEEPKPYEIIERIIEYY